MKYENTLVKVLPELKKYLSKLSWKLTGYIEDEEIFSRAIETVCTVVEKKDNIKNPEKFIKGVFWRAVQNIQGNVVKERDRMHGFTEETKKEFDNEEGMSDAGGILAELDRFAEGTTNTIWQELKRHQGDIKAVTKELDVHEQTVFYHKRKLKEEYKNLRLSYSG